MKATEYYEKVKPYYAAYHDAVSTAAPEETVDVAKKAFLAEMEKVSDEFINEFSTICKQRHATTNRAFVSVMKELNQKWNKVCRLFDDDFGICPIAKNFVNRFVVRILPQIQMVEKNLDLSE